jgi:hypothetical protein
MTERDTIQTASQVRDGIIGWLRRELVGPAPGHPFMQLNREEILRPQDPPRYRYACGILFPNGVAYSGSEGAAAEERDAIENAPAVDASEQAVAADVADPDEEREAEEEIAPTDAAPGTEAATETDEETSAASLFLPSTMGLSFLADVSAGLTIAASWAIYKQVTVEGYPASRDGTVPRLWFRYPKQVALDFTPEELRRAQQRQTISDSQSDGVLDLDIVSRPWKRTNQRLITVTLVNATPTQQPINENSFFQCGLTVKAPHGSSIVAYPDRSDGGRDREELSMALLYRYRPVYAVGHGCAADWDLHEKRVVSARTEVLPSFSQAPVLARPDVNGVNLSMLKLATGSKEDVNATCLALLAAYQGWIKDREADLAIDPSIVGELKDAARDHLADCRRCAERIAMGIQVLGRDDRAFRAFQLMNRAMVEQREHYDLASNSDKRRSWTKGPNGPEPSAPFVVPTYSTETAWRPFQLAFILMNLRAFTEPWSDDRRIVDTIWFPTGGGKTEAYLGLAAFVILHRRLVDPSNAGTTVLMRYTLRLLTTQQFQRAASLICALELIRRSDAVAFGPEPITLGLWLGSGVTPNREDQAVKDYQSLAQGEGGNRFVVLSCPWCGVDMGPREYGREIRAFGYQLERVAAGRRRFVFRCEDATCAFSAAPGLPLTVIDEAIYASPPTLLIGTVDKFAMLPWTPDARAIFGLDNAAAGTPPDLIIQDELHLISGPLGSMVGHYETVIDEFTTRVEGGTRIGAKIVASTATIARAAEQVGALYGRASSLFPPQGLSADDSFFAREGSAADGRTYVGVLASALPSHITAQVWTLSILLQAPSLFDGPDEAIDPYWTLMAYFNSLRELGRAATLVQADIRERLNAVWDRIGISKEMMRAGGPDLRRFINNFRELTSRLRSDDIPFVLQELFTAYPDERAIDLCYATNMIQVGLDVPRLSIMTIVGQPKGTSEYIQASSRVGRTAGRPGLVITNYNPFKPRDRSHFESFRGYHESVYKHVEPTSVTPFSVPVSERAIHALAVALIRFRYPALRGSPRAEIPPNVRNEICGIVRNRIQLVAPAEEARGMAILDEFLDDWMRVRPNLYGNFMDQTDDETLLWPAGRPFPPGRIGNTISRPTASSMRSVDAECEAFPVRNYQEVES